MLKLLSIIFWKSNSDLNSFLFYCETIILKANVLIAIFFRIGYSIPMFAGFVIMFVSTISKWN
jgi:hypothetical protein